MFKRALRVLDRLRKCGSGNATLLVAVGMPMLLGGTGFAVDTAQWYMWKRELQFATDQAAIAAAWALSDSDTRNTYTTRGTQEYNANLATTTDFASTPTIQLADFAGGNDNSVIVQASATKTLPFSGVILGQPTTVSVYSQAQFEEGATYSSCLLAVDEDDTGAITIGGNTVLTAGCGMAALSDAEEAISVNGNPTIDVNRIMTRGGVDPWLYENTDDAIITGLGDELADPFADLSPPNPASSQVPRTLTCPSGSGSTTTTADVTTSVTTSYAYYKGPNRNNVVSWPSYSPQKTGGTATSGPTNTTVAEGTVAGSTTNTTTDWFNVSGNGNNKIWEVTTTTTTTTYANVQVTAGESAATVLPGTYTDMRLSCDTVFSGGVYVIDGGTLEIHSQYNVTGAGVMFVLKNGAGLVVNGGSNVNLTAMTVSELLAQGISAEDASRLAGMLIFEDRNSSGNNGNMINGNATTVLNGTIYLPVSNINFSGTASVSSQCLMIAASTITFTGTTDMTTFCPDGVDLENNVVTMGATVKLVA